MSLNSCAMGKSDQTKEQHFHRIIDTYKEINRLLVKEDNPKMLIRKACDILVHTRGYYFVWIGLFGDEQKLNHIESAGEASGLEELEEQAREGILPQLYQTALNTNELGVYSTRQCDCPVKIKPNDWTAFVAPIYIDNSVSGLICASIPNSDAQHPKEKQTFSDIAKSIGTALAKIEIQKKLHTTQQQAQQNESKFRDLFNAINDAILIHPYIENEAACFIETNKHASRIYGYSNSEFKELTARDLTPPTADNQAIAAQNRKQLKNPGWLHCEMQHQKKNGESFPVEIRSQVFERDGKQFIISIVHDISYRKKTEKQLKASEQRYKAVFENTATATCILEADGTISLANAQFEELAGYSLDEILNKKTWMEFVAPADLLMMKQQHKLRRVDADRSLKNYQFRFIDKKGTQKHINLIVDMITGSDKSVASLIDISPIVHYENKLLSKNQQLEYEKEKAIEAGERYHSLFSNSASAMLLLEPKSGAIVDANNAACKFYKYSYEEITALNINQLNTLPSEDMKKRLNIASKKQSHFQFVHRLGDGSTKNVEVYSGLASFSGKSLLYSIIHDITARKEAEQKLLASEHLQHNILQSMPVGFVMIDSEYVIKRVNDQACQITGYTKDQLIGNSCANLCTNELGCMQCPVWDSPNEAFSGKDSLVKRRDGSTISVLKNAQTVVIDGEKYILESFIDNSKQKEAEFLLTQEKLKAEENEQKFTAFMNFLPGQAYIKDKDSRYLFVNQFMHKNLGAEKWLGKIPQDVLPPAKVIEVRKNDAQTTRLGRHKFEEHFSVLGRGERDYLTYQFTINGNDKDALIGGISLDITTRKKLESANLMFSKAMDSSPVSIVITDIEGNIEYVNPFFEEKTGYPLAHVLGKNPRILKSGEQDDAFYEELWSTISSGKVWHGEFHNKTRSGHLFWEQASISPILNEKGEIVQFVAIKEDVSEKKQTLKDLQSAKEKAEESDKLKSAFLANMSHEIRTPMNGILGFTELLKEPDLSGEQKKEFVSVIQKSGERMLSTINDIIDISKVESGVAEVHLSELELQSFLFEIYSFFSPETSKKGVELVLKNAEDATPYTFNTDAEKLHSILTNLIKNAIKFTHEGSITFGYTLTDEEITFCVCDTGIGIPSNRQKAIFDRFVQADIADSRVYEGSGLGLSISKSYTELLGGNIQLESQEGEGTTFLIRFPLPRKREEPQSDQIANQNNSEEMIAPGIKLNILVAEDDFVSVELLKLFLKPVTRSVIFVDNGIDAIEKMKQHPEIELIMMDIKMPKMDGMEATRRIREFNSEVKIIAQTAFAQAQDSQRALEAGCNGFVTKPILKKDLLHKIEQLFQV